MARQTVDTLLSYAFATQRKHEPVRGEDGLVVHDGSGEPKTQELTILVFFDPQSGHQVHVPLTEEGRVNLARELTGGLILAANGGVPS